MADTIYDEHVRFYVDFVDRVLSDPTGFNHVLLARFEAILGDRLDGARVCDIACGEGYLSRFLGSLGPREVIGIDRSAELVRTAAERADAAHLTFRVDDARRLESIGDSAIDVAVSQLAIMDIDDHAAMFRAAYRVLRHDGVFAFSLLHPCFEGPFRLPEEPQFLCDSVGHEIGVVVRRYASEGFWQSGGSGVRGRMGAHHRMLSTLVNDLLASGFALERIDEPVLNGDGLFSQVPRSILIAARARKT